MLIPPLGEAGEYVIHLAGIGHEEAKCRSDAAQMNKTDILQFGELLPPFEFKTQYTIIQRVRITRMRRSLTRRLIHRALHATTTNDCEPRPQYNIERRIPRMLGSLHLLRIHLSHDPAEPPHRPSIQQRRVRPGFQILHQPLPELNAIRLQLLTKILPPRVDAPGGQNDPGGRTSSAQGAQQSRELLLSGLLRVVDHDEKLGGELRKVCQIGMLHRALGGRKTCVPAKNLQIVTQLRSHTGLTRPSRTGQHGNRDVWLPSGALGSSHRPFPELPILRTRTEWHHAVTGLDHLQRRTVIRQRQVTGSQHFFSASQGGEL